MSDFVDRQKFSPSRALEAVCERWSLLVFRDAMYRGTTRFNDFERHADVAPDILGERLDGLVGAGLMEARQASDQPDVVEYILTEKGRNLEPVITALTTWADGWTDPADAPSAGFEHETEIASGLRESHPEPGAGVKSDPAMITISLLGTFAVRVAGEATRPLTVGSQRLLVFLALHHRAVTRIAMAGTMWPDASDERAGISLRSALSRLDTTTREAIRSASAGLSLAEAVAVDFRDAQALARRLLQPKAGIAEGDLGPAALSALSKELLPDWYDDWVVVEAEEWRVLRMSALEAMAGHLADQSRLAEAAEAARAAIKVEPLRESGYASLIRVHLAEGNQSEALKVFERYSALLMSVLGLEPTALLTDLVTSIKKA